MADLFEGSTGGPNGIGSGTPDIWFDGNHATAGTCNGFANTIWDVGAAVTIDAIRVRWAYGGLLGGGAAGAFAIDTGPTITGPWTQILNDDDPTATAGQTYPGDFANVYAVGATSRYWRFRSTTANNNDIFTIEGIEPTDPGPEPPPYEPPEPGQAIVEIYVTDPDGYRWDEALWDAATWSDDEWVSITPWVIFADLTWGADRADPGILADQKAGSWVVQTHDPDRVLDPGNAESQFYPLLVPDLPIRVNHEGVTVRTGQVTDVQYSHAEHGGRIAASDAIARASRASVPPGTALGDTFLTRIEDAIAGAGIQLHVAVRNGWIMEHALAPDDPDAKRTVWQRISEAARELLAVPWVDRDGHIRVTAWDDDTDRGLTIDSSIMVDLAPFVSYDGLYSVVRALDADGVTIAESKAAPLPAYGEVVYERTEPTIDSESWTARVLADRVGAVLRYRPGTIVPMTAEDNDALVDMELLDIITLSFPEADPPISVRARVLGARVRVTDRTKQLPAVLTRWEWTLLTTIVPDQPLISDNDASIRYLLSDADGVSFLYPG
jgi:hypothetical protein